MQHLSILWRWCPEGLGAYVCRAAVVLLAVAGVAGCTSQQPQATHHWVSQDKVAGSVYRNDVAACSQGAAKLSAKTPEFAAYKDCMSERGYALVAAADLGETGKE